MSENEAFLSKYLSDPITGLKEWLVSFMRVLVNPRPQTFREIADHSQGKFRAAVLWMVIFSFLIYLVSAITSGVVVSPQALLSFILFTPLAILLWVFCLHFIYRLLFRGDHHPYVGLLCALVCIVVPLNLVRALLLAIPYAGVVLSGLVIAYQVVLAVVAVYAITQVSVAQAVLAVVVSSLTAAGVIYLLSIFLLSLASATAMFL